MTARKLIYGLVFAGCVLYAQAQAPAAGTTPAPAATPPQVHLAVLALDSHNQPVGDLTADNFQITDQGKAQRIVSFHRAEAAAALAPHEFSNRVATGSHTTVILFDLLNQGRMDGLEAAKKIGHALAQIPSGDSLYFYILGLDGNLFPIHAIPEPGAAPAADDKTWTQQADAEIQTALKTVNRARKAGMTQEDFVKKTYVGLEMLAKDLTAFRGSRDIIWVTDGVPQVYQEKNCSGDWFGDCALYVPHLNVRLAAAKAAVFPLTYTVSPDANMSRDMENFAFSTGGRTFSGIELSDVLAQIASDAKNAYVVAYEPSADNWDGRSYHKIKVACDRKGVRIQTKNRYYAVPVADQQAPGALVAKDEDAAIIAALGSPVDIPDIGLNVAVSPAAGGKKAVHFLIRINAADLHLREQAGAFDDQIAVMFADYTASGLKGVPLPSDFNLHMTPEQHARVMKDGLSFGVDHAVDSTINQVRFVVFDHASNAYGSLSIPVAAPAAPAAAAAPAPAAPAAH
jgi:VWFA-related protein